VRAWLLPLAIAVAYSLFLYRVRDRIPRRVAEWFGPAGGALNALYTLGLFGSIATGTAYMAPWIVAVAVGAQLCSLVTDYELKRGWYPKLAGAVMFLWQLYVFFTMAGITVVGLHPPPELGETLPFDEAIILPALLTAIAVLILLQVRVPERLASALSLGSVALWVLHWFAADVGSTTGHVVLPLWLASIPALAMMVRMVYEYAYERHWSGQVTSSLILAETWFLALWFAGVSV